MNWVYRSLRLWMSARESAKTFFRRKPRKGSPGFTQIFTETKGYVFYKVVSRETASEESLAKNIRPPVHGDQIQRSHESCWTAPPRT